LGSGTLDPRPETEILVDRALDLFRAAPPRRFLDLGTGTGCIPITLLSKWPGSYAIAVDLSESALNTARINARKHGVSERLGLVCGEWAGALATGFDLILSNPPYIPSAEIKNLEEGVRNHDPILALDGGDDGLEAYKNIFSSLKWHLNRGGKALFEIGAGQSDDVVRLAGNHGLCVEAVRPDYAGIQRVVEISSGDK
ncbi:MAG: peptide chain release factor N(5)-glutamine methyltransferase, partial [Alphaproteobacteria bacterium]